MADSTRVIYNESSSMNQGCYTNQAMAIFHNDVIKLETISAFLTLCEGKPPLSELGFLIDAWQTAEQKKRNAGDLRRHHAQYLNMMSL